MGYANSICILRTSCDVSNLTGNDWSSYVTVFILFFCTTDGNSGSFRLPNASRISAVVISRRIITDYILIDRSYRIGAESYTAIDFSIGIMAEDNCFFLFCCNWFLFVCIADDDVIGLTFCYGAIIAKDSIGISAFVDGDVLAQYFHMTGISNGTVEAVQIIVLHLLISRRFHGVPYTHDL